MRTLWPWGTLYALWPWGALQALWPRKAHWPFHTYWARTPLLGPPVRHDDRDAERTAKESQGVDQEACDGELYIHSATSLRRITCRWGPHLSRVFDRLEALEPKVIAPMRGPGLTGGAVQALRDLHRALRIAKPGHMVPDDDTGTAER